MTAERYPNILSFDVGLKRTGMAVAQISSEVAQAAGVIPVNNGRHDWQQVDHALNEWQPSQVIVGKASDTDPALKKAVNRLLSHIQQNHKIPIELVDETLTTVSANVLLSESDYSTQKRRDLRDQVAACLILETWLHDHRER